ncbi:MAG: glycosyltransferase [Clostridia bacterium]|nr:glycosyltransferase [Clostridia bacterium]
MKKILFLIHDLGQGGAEKVLVNLVNNMDSAKFDITVVTIFGGGVNEQFLKPHIKLRSVFKKAFPGNSKIMKLFTPKFLHRWFIKEHYDIEVSYLEGPSARIISGCPSKDTKLVSWIHVQQETKERLSGSFKSFSEARSCYERFDNTVCVSEFVKNDFSSILSFNKPIEVLYNTVESDVIRILSEEKDVNFTEDNKLRLIAVGTLKQSKGYVRLLNVIKKLDDENYPVHLYILGIGPLKEELEAIINKESMDSYVTLLGYDTNPYKYVAKSDVFVCASFAEGFSTAATESLIVGTPVVTVEVSGMKEMLGDNDEYGIVTENNEDALYEGIKKMISTPGMLEDYAKRAEERGKYFSTENTVKAVERMFDSL